MTAKMHLATDRNSQDRRPCFGGLCQAAAAEKLSSTPEVRGGVGELGSAKILNLQRTFGNQAVQRVLAAGQSLQGPKVGGGDSPKGLPRTLRTGLEQLSGFDLSGVRVHYNSNKPAQFQALAYAQGQDIHVSPGQERHLPHEGWHVVQQLQGRVRPTMQMHGVSINDSSVFEHEADAMGRQALSVTSAEKSSAPEHTASGPEISSAAALKYVESTARQVEVVDRLVIDRSEATVGQCIQRVWNVKAKNYMNLASRKMIESEKAYEGFDEAIEKNGAFLGSAFQAWDLNQLYLNVIGKTRNVATTGMGTAHELKQWGFREHLGAYAIRGPGGTSGVDVVDIPQQGFSGFLGQVEVKTAGTVDSFRRGVADASKYYSPGGVLTVVVYLSAPNLLSQGNFWNSTVRKGVTYVFSGPGSQLTFFGNWARVVVYDTDGSREERSVVWS